MKKILLGSASPRRKELLQLIGLDFDVIVSDIEEIVKEGLMPQEVVLEIALQKSKFIAKNLTNEILITADTIVVLENEILGKPKDIEEAKLMLRKLSGKAHQVYTAFVIQDIEAKKIDYDVQKTTVQMMPYDEAQIQAYIETKESLDKAGAYGIQGYGALLVEQIEGDYFNVMGLPISLLNRRLKQMGIKTIL